MGASVPVWPEVESPLLAEFINSLRQRSKAIKYHTFRWTCSAEFEQIDDGGLEAVTIGLWDFHERRLNIKVWSDGELWLYIREHRNQTWHFEFTFYARITSGDGENVTKAIEASFAAVSVQDNSEKEQQLISIWAQYSPYNIKRGRA